MLFKSLNSVEIHSVVEDASVAVDYTFRTEKLFDFTQIEFDQMKRSQNESIVESRIQIEDFANLNKQLLAQLESFSLDEKIKMA